MVAKRLDENTQEAVDLAVDEIDRQEVDAGAETADAVDELVLPDTAQRSRPWWRRKKFLIWTSLVVLLVAIVCLVPFLRYGVMGVFVHKDVTLKVVDADSGKPVTGVAVTLGSKDVVTDKNGQAKFTDVAVGDHYVKIDKKYYRAWSGSVLVPIFANTNHDAIRLKATGRTITVRVLQSITLQPVSDVKVSIGDVSSLSDTKGIASVVVAVGSTLADGKVSGAKLVTTDFSFDPNIPSDQTIDVKLAPEGKVYFLSKASGVISVMSANLDGSSPQVLVPGTGKEYDRDTSIVASKDWRYAILSSSREGKPRLYLVDTRDGSLQKIDDENGVYQNAGWLGNSFIYTIVRERESWKPGQVAIKSFNAETKKLTTVDETQASGSSYFDYTNQVFSEIVLTTNKIVYGRSWYASMAANLDGKKAQLINANSDGTKISLKDQDANNFSFNALRLHAPNSVYVLQYQSSNNGVVVYDLVDGKLQTSQLDQAAFNGLTLPLIRVSPSGTKTAWDEMRDGQYVSFVGDANGKSGQQMAPTGFRVYGWVGDSYILLTKNGSELYIYPAAGGIEQPLKIANYHKPVDSWLGIGYAGGV